MFAVLTENVLLLAAWPARTGMHCVRVSDNEARPYPRCTQYRHSLRVTWLHSISRFNIHVSPNVSSSATSILRFHSRSWKPIVCNTSKELSSFCLWAAPGARRTQPFMPLATWSCPIGHIHHQYWLDIQMESVLILLLNNVTASVSQYKVYCC